MSKLESIRETVRLALIELAEQLPEQRPDFWALFWERYVEHKLDYRSTDVVFKEKHRQAGADAQQLLLWLEALPVEIRQGRQTRLLREVFEQYYVVSAQEVTPVKKHAGGVVQNPHDPKATWCAKGKAKAKKEWIGYKVQVAESLGPQRTQKSEPTHNFLTSVVTQAATESDDAGMKATLEAQAQMGLEKPTELLVDAGYISAEAIVEAQAQGRELVGPARPSPHAARGTGTESFDVCVQERRAICPAGYVNTQCSRLEEKASGKVTYRFEWSTHCHQCVLRAKCVGQGQTHRSLVVGEHHTALQTRRHEQKSEQFARRMHERNGIEGTQSEMVRAHGLRRARYRGKTKDDLQNQLIGAACNIKRWLKLVAWELRVAAMAAASALKSKTAFAS